MPHVKKILNFHEAATHQRLATVCERYGASVHTKMRVADVLAIEQSGIDAALFNFALRSHFDFVVADDDAPIFAVEFDGPTHQTGAQQTRDEKKLLLCRRFDFPILRITARYLHSINRNYDLLSWCVEYWFLQREIDQAQASGSVPRDEYLDPMLFVSLPGKTGRFPMWMSAEPKITIQRLCTAGRCRDASPSYWIGADDRDNYRGLMWLSIDDRRWVLVKTAARSQLFPVDLSELVTEILSFEALHALEDVLAGGSDAIDGNSLNAVIKEYQQRFRMMCGGGVIRDEANIDVPGFRRGREELA
jgi:Protein of unknown function (DUF2726)